MPDEYSFKVITMLCAINACVFICTFEYTTTVPVNRIISMSKLQFNNFI